ncbi:dihydrofolate reductase family protein [Streptomyces sp. NPDC007264]|uniref:dihydrofolate reductase family protein n=1 Tax=Streptomyces sp. NPDC007264 TaxID=3364777 RepID=UPI0036DE215B
MAHPYVLLSAAVSLDGFLDDTGPERLLLSGPEDFDRVDEVRAGSDAILVGAGTVRTDNPRLLVNSARRRAARVAAGLPEYPLKVTVSVSGDLDPEALFWHTGGAKVVYSTDKGAERLRELLPAGVEVVALGPDMQWRDVLDHLGDVKGVRRLMVEGGGQVHTQLLRQGLADELQLALAPMFVGEPEAPRMFGPGPYPPGRMRLVETRAVGDVVLMRYVSTAPGTGRLASAADRRWLETACALAAQCPPSRTAFSVGAVIVAADGTELARAHSREGDPVVHAEEAALAKLDPADPRLTEATVYSSLEPCARRASRPAPCARLIIDAGVRRVVTAWREPDTFVASADGTALLAAQGVEVVLLPEYEDLAKAPNAHLLPPEGPSD